MGQLPIMYREGKMCWWQGWPFPISAFGYNMVDGATNRSQHYVSKIHECHIYFHKWKFCPVCCKFPVLGISSDSDGNNDNDNDNSSNIKKMKNINKDDGENDDNDHNHDYVNDDCGYDDNGDDCGCYHNINLYLVCESRIIITTKLLKIHVLSKTMLIRGLQCQNKKKE